MAEYPQVVSVNSNPIEQLTVLKSGEYFNQSMMGGSLGTLAFNKTLKLYPIFRTSSITIDTIGINVTSTTAGYLCKICIYDNVDSKPKNLLFASDDIDVGTTGYKSTAVDFTFESGVTYWIGSITNNSVTMRSIASSTLPLMGMNAGTDVSILSHYNLTYGSYPATLPDDLSIYGTLAKSVGNIPSVVMRIA